MTDCIEVSGRLFCETERWTPVTLIVVSVILWILFLGWLWTEKDIDGFYVFGGGLVLPIIILALWLVFG